MTEKALVVTSGGLDSTTLLYKIVKENPDLEVSAISFSYGQRHVKELAYAAANCIDLDVRHVIADIRTITSLLAHSGSSLVSDSEVPEGHYAEETMKATVVPNRNMIMASIAAGHGIAIGASTLWMGVHAGDHFIYPDCRPAFFNLLNGAIVVGNEGFGPIPEIENNLALAYVRTPYINNSKADIAYDALNLNVPLENTWSCYKGGDVHCGKCGTCVERLEAINIAQTRLIDEGKPVPADNTIYADTTFWREALNRETV